ncbi:MAG TPA: GIY-YIG nuclease family protein, partial [Candidatus Polarisedimenticolaceae bacterium]|nr:GIY-YIG nuclease family protein [Candidatus Polarisedimenticolaceae bacterium]
LRLRGDDVISACGGQLVGPAPTDSLRPALHEALLDAVPVVHDAPGALPAFEDWLGEPVERPLSLRRLGHERLGLPARHDMSALAARLGLSWREGEDPLEQAEVLDACLRGLRRADETLDELREATVAPELDWTRFEFSREFLRNIPALPGTYRFRDAQGGLLYVGKSSDLRRRIGSYFREGRPRSPREQALLDALVRIEYTPSGSELEAVLREAEQIRRRNPAANTQREVHAQSGRAARLRSILILEGAETPWVLRAFLIHDGRLLGRVRIGRRGGGLAQVQRLLDDYFFSAPGGPTATPGPDLEVELVARWLAAHRDRAVAFDPTDLQSSAEVIERLRWFLARGDAHEPDGTPILPR